jgi:hypothetical protein
MRGFRDALRADPVLRRRYAALKRAIVAGGPADPVAFTKAKHDWIAATLTWLGLADDQPRRLYQDDLNPDNPDRYGPDREGSCHGDRRGQTERAAGRSDRDWGA